MIQTIEFDKTEGYPYHQTLSAFAHHANTPEDLEPTLQNLWPTMDYFVENCRFGQAVKAGRAITALCFPLGRPTIETYARVAARDGSDRAFWALVRQYGWDKVAEVWEKACELEEA